MSDVEAQFTRRMNAALKRRNLDHIDLEIGEHKLTGDVLITTSFADRCAMFSVPDLAEPRLIDAICRDLQRLSAKAEREDV